MMKKIILVLLILLFVNPVVYADAGSKTIIDGYASNSDYKVANVKIINDNDANFTIRRINRLICLASQMRTDKFVNQTYRRFFDSRICSDLGREFDITVSTRRTNNSAPQETDFWIDTNEIGRMTAHTSNNFQIQHEVEGLSELELIIKPDFISYAYKGTGILSTNILYPITERAVANKKDRVGGFTGINSTDSSTSTRIELQDWSVIYAYDDRYLYINTTTTIKGTSTFNNQPYIRTIPASQCLSREASQTIALLYNIYDYDDGSLKTLNTGFYFSYQDNDNATKYSYINNLGIRVIPGIGYEYPKKIKRLSDGADLTLRYDGFDFTDNVLSTFTYIGKGSITITDSAGSVTIFQPLELEFAYKKSDAQNPVIDMAEGTYTANIGRIFGNINEKILYIDGKYITKPFTSGRLIPNITLKDGTLLRDRESDKKYITKAIKYSRFYVAAENADNCSTLARRTADFSLPSLNIDTSKVLNLEDKPKRIVEIF